MSLTLPDRPSRFSATKLLGCQPLPGIVVIAALVLSSACATSPVDRSEDQVRKGVEAADQGYWEEAEFRWRKALARSARDARAENNLGVRYENQGEFEQAREHYERALELADEPERRYVEANWERFEPILRRVRREDAEAEPAEETEADDEPAAVDPEAPPAGLQVVEILISVPDQGPNLAGYDRILVGNFVPTEETEADINDFAVRFLRRRITQRTFFQTQDLVDQPLPPEVRQDGVLAHRELWVERAGEVDADLVLTGRLGYRTSEESQMVRERIRSPDGEIREVARFEDSVVYTVQLDYYVLSGEDGDTLLEGSLQGEQSFPAEEGISESEAVLEAMEELLPKLLDAITPQRSDQSRYLIY